MYSIIEELQKEIYGSEFLYNIITKPDYSNLAITAILDNKRAVIKEVVKNNNENLV